MAFDRTSVAFIGLGVMGYPMAVNLRKKMSPEVTLCICDVSETALSRFQAEMSGEGPIKVVKNGFEAANASDIVLSMLPSSAAVKSVYCDPQTGILGGAKVAFQKSRAPKLLMECGTIESDTIAEVARSVSDTSRELGDNEYLSFVDAPVSGGPMGAEAGTLTFMVGTDRPDQTFDTVKQVLNTMGSPGGIFLCGDIGAGTAFKVINNYLSAITSLAASEALNIGSKLGLNIATLTDVINASGGQCWVTSKSNPVPGIQPNTPASRDYEGGFRIELCRKVLKMGSDLAASVGARTVLDRSTLKAFDECMSDPRYSGKDARVVYKWLNESVNS
ncbi:hypothetical protein COCCADRAFT_30161 [Bipolaris zeicola 26-R-13]|uniref:3-hydroxyisobutyrate dehydrogenase n=1 Tax=Cochliobolus carbonum (strain 26-R-13) TaxID=930089 RepID=W6XSH1_COCC2|nr:uncharacterized protein COCCADRAFT_30161 [Bipolaris zeicola 26-R-13]EUC28618.1 hypothetical protein COCCADRAFT_30161 [Bipolaris zeicola 26-R-13]